VCCPACGDNRFRLYFSYMSHTYFYRTKKAKTPIYLPWIYDCKNEKCRRELWDWLIQVFGDMENQDLSKMAPRLVDGPVKDKSPDLLKMDFTVPENMTGLMEETVPEESLDYLYSRGFDPRELDEKFKCKFIPTGSEWKDNKGEIKKVFREPHIFCPGIQGRRLVGWQARILRRAYPGESKYYNMPGGAKYIYNFDQAIRYRDIMITEGVTDVWRAGPHSMAILGNSISSKQRFCIKTVWSMWGRGVFMVECEEQTRKSMKKSAERLIKSGAFPDGVTMVGLKEKDPAEYSYADLDVIFQEALDLADHSLEYLDVDELLEGSSEELI